ncbi:hypothetical protein Pelo_2946 [Pelomyxa schiedti]|nr:hypothetical protein Pelo_2946 [Pelomyxa schiedti]
MTTDAHRCPVTAEPAIPTAQSQLLSLMLAAHPRCGARTALASSSSAAPGGLWLSFLRALWSDFIVPSQLRLVADLDLCSLPDVGLQVCVHPVLGALTRPVTTHKYVEGLRMGADHHLVSSDKGKLCVVAAAGDSFDVSQDASNSHKYAHGCNSTWILMFKAEENGFTVTTHTMTITKALDLDALKFEQCDVELPFRCYVKDVSFCTRPDHGQAVVVLRKPSDPLLCIMVVDVAKSFTSRDLVVLSSTRCAVTDEPQYLVVCTILSMRQSTGARCFVLVASPDCTLNSYCSLCMICDSAGTVSEFPVGTKMDPLYATLSKLSPTQFCVSHRSLVEIWDCGNDSGPPRVVRVLQSELGYYVDEVEANSGFLFVRLRDKIKVIEASTGVCWITVGGFPDRIMRMDQVTCL